MNRCAEMREACAMLCEAVRDRIAASTVLTKEETLITRDILEGLAVRMRHELPLPLEPSEEFVAHRLYCAVKSHVATRRGGEGTFMDTWSSINKEDKLIWLVLVRAAKEVLL